MIDTMQENEIHSMKLSVAITMRVRWRVMVHLFQHVALIMMVRMGILNLHQN